MIMKIRNFAILKRFARDKSGVAAIEFAIIAPVMLIMYMGTLEVSHGIQLNKRVSRTATLAGDLVSQLAQVTESDIDDIMKIGGSVIQPYNKSKPMVTISQIYIDNTLTAKVTWSRRQQWGGSAYSYFEPYPKTSVTTVPANLRIADTYLLRAETQIQYEPITSWVIKNSFSMNETYYLRPRVNLTVDCTDC